LTPPLRERRRGRRRGLGVWAVDDPGAWEPRSRDLAVALGLDHQRLWAWCGAFAAMLAASRAARGASAEQVAALLALSP
jgi:hypothetical protein